MDDPTRRCENDTDNGTRLLGAPGPKREPHFFCAGNLLFAAMSARFSCNADSVDVEGFERSMIAQDCSTVRAEVD